MTRLVTRRVLCLGRPARGMTHGSVAGSGVTRLGLTRRAVTFMPCSARRSVGRRGTPDGGVIGLAVVGMGRLRGDARGRARIGRGIVPAVVVTAPAERHALLAGLVVRGRAAAGRARLALAGRDRQRDAGDHADLETSDFIHLENPG
jgi:hypothetical protein